MTNTETRIDLDDYLKTLNDLIIEIEAYGTERRSLAELTASLKELHVSNKQIVTGVEQNLSANASVLNELRELQLSDLQDEVRDRYETHQHALSSMTTSLQQAVHEQQRAGLEMLQNAAHNKQLLEQYAERVEAASTTHAKNHESVISQIGHLSSGQASIAQQLESLASDHVSITETLTVIQKRLLSLRLLSFVALILIAAVGVVVITI